MSDRMTPEIADALAAVSAASHQRGWIQGYEAGQAAAAAEPRSGDDEAYARGLTDGHNLHLLMDAPVNLGGPYNA